MSKDTEKEDLVIRYFFGELDEDEEDRIEQSFLTDNQFFEQMRSIEQALIDDYAKGRLSDLERKKIEAFLQSSRRLGREINSTKNFINALSKTKTINDSKANADLTERLPLWKSFLALLGVRDSNNKFSFVLPLIVLAFGLGLIFWNIALNYKLSKIEAMQVELGKQNRDLQEELNLQSNSSKSLSRQIEEVEKRSEQIEQEFIARQESGASPIQRNIVSLALTLQSFNRDTGQLKEVRIDTGTKWLQITINISGGVSEAYSAVINTFEDRFVWGKDSLKPAPRNPDRVVLIVPAGLLADGDYALTLKDDTSVLGDYYFRVKKHR